MFRYLYLLHIKAEMHYCITIYLNFSHIENIVIY